MIVSANIRGFKRFKDQRFKFAPLTMLTGLNGSGKTSLIHAVLLAHEAATSRKMSVRLNGPFGIELGTAEDVLNWEARDGLELAFENDDGTISEWQLTMPYEEALYLVVRKMPANLPSSFRGKPRSLTYLSAERFGPRGSGATSPLPAGDLEVGTHGEFCAHVLSEIGSSVIDNADRSHPLSDSAVPRLLKYELEQWLGEIARPVEVDGSRLSNSSVAELRYRTTGTQWVRATNMGFGVTYALPVILAGLIAARDSLLIVENPEAHLHPAGQSRMGVFLSWLAAHGVQVLLETHSDHVINGVRRGIAEYKYLDPQAAVVHWFGGFEDAGEENSIKELEINANGAISSWPRGFFDQYQLDVASLGRIRRARL